MNDNKDGISCQCREEENMATAVLKKQSKPGLTPSKKEAFKKLIGSASCKIDLNKVRDEWKNENN
ncbi:MAG: hypothetical protein A2Y21_01255 [Clostridiales bacterium GWC2_40_7]|nr:MAG: hypothetical protein A2Y21_01255 [Clostridiales bacterium GWC2_40_7]